MKLNLIFVHIILVFNIFHYSIEDTTTNAVTGPIDGEKLQLIFPGTKWCGQGNVATHENDYGQFASTDMCCKAHDYCPDFISAGDTKYGLTNNAMFTKVHCDCDEQFHGCLKEANTFVSQKVGSTYFDVVGSDCFKNEHPIVKCIRYSEILKTRCVEYELDTTKPKKWQYFDNQLY